MTGKDIEYFYNVYKHNLYEIKSIEKSILTESYNYEKWSARLEEKSVIIRGLYEDNEDMLDKTIRHLKAHPKELNDELATALLQHINFFIYENHKDHEVTSDVLDFLMPYLKEHGQEWQLIKAYYIQGIFDGKWYERGTFDSRQRNVLFSFYTDWNEADRDGTKERILDAYLDRAISIAKSENAETAQVLEVIEEGIREWTRPQAQALVMKIHEGEGGLSTYIENKIRLLRFAVTFLVEPETVHEMTPRQKQEVHRYLLEELEREKEEESVNCRMYLKYYQFRYLTGEITKQQYTSKLQAYKKPEPYYYPSDLNCIMQYGKFDSIIEHNRYFTDSFSYALLLAPELLKLTENRRLKITLCRNIEQYIQGLYPMENSYIMDYHIVQAMAVMIRDAEDDVAFRVLETVFMHRQMTTAIHSAMVSKLSTMMVRHFITTRPDIFIGVLGTKTIEDVFLWQLEIEDYVRKAALCHDIGKLECTDIINLQSRKITEKEFDKIKNHPQAGADIANRIAAFKPYTNIILGHHKFCNNEDGYPADMNLFDSTDRVLIDLISICDSIDAATDVLGRNYAKGKAFRQIIKELKEQQESRYSKTLVQLLCSDTLLLREMSDLTGKGRTKVYHEIYARCVKPIVKYGKADERHIRDYTDRDIRAVRKFLLAANMEGVSKKWQPKLYEEKYVVTNTKKEVVGILLGVKENKGIRIEVIYISEHLRRMNVGGKLLEYAEEQLRKSGYQYICANSLQELGPVNRFLWINGFTKDKNDRLIKYID